MGILDPSNPIELEIALERLSYDRVTINRILAGRRRNESAGLLRQIAANLGGMNANSSTDKPVEVESGDGDEVGPS